VQELNGGGGGDGDVWAAQVAHVQPDDGQLGGLWKQLLLHHELP
tara:strand:- start:2121 stop:2252 length:132 start_codon:yes stop_codon:yes gene_type:complete